MVVSLVLTGLHSIGLDDKGRFKHGENIIHIDEIPYVRYRFTSFGPSEIEYITKMQAKFFRSTHLAEITLSENTLAEFAATDDIEHLARYLYVNVTEAEIQAGTLSNDTQSKLIDVAEADLLYDRIMLKDVSKSLYSRVFNAFRDTIAGICDVKPDDVGACSSPMSFNGDACLTAVRARELSSEYSGEYIGKTPSANHECMNTCGCIKYIVIDHDIKVSLCSGSGTKSASGSGKGSSGGTKTPKTLPILLARKGNALSTLSGNKATSGASSVPKPPLNSEVVTQQPAEYPGQMSFETLGSPTKTYIVPEDKPSGIGFVSEMPTLPAPESGENNNSTSCESAMTIDNLENNQITIGTGLPAASETGVTSEQNFGEISIPKQEAIQLGNDGISEAQQPIPMIPSAIATEQAKPIEANGISITI